VVCSWILAILWGLYVWNKVPIIKRSFFISAILAGVILIFSVSVAFVKSSNEDNTFYGILFNEKLAVWAEPNTRAEVLFLLHEGTKVQMLDKLQEWQKIRITNGSEGWVKDGEIRDLKGFK
jgi:SH3-like domain-containing protein